MRDVEKFENIVNYVKTESKGRKYGKSAYIHGYNVMVCDVPVNSIIMHIYADATLICSLALYRGHLQKTTPNERVFNEIALAVI